MVSANSICRIHFSEGLPYCILKWDGNILIRGEINLMQYTGLKDKNGKEIYEGDVVKCPDLLGDWVVKWKDLGWIIRNGDGLTTNLHSSQEIINNIYENPEFLDESHK